MIYSQVCRKMDDYRPLGRVFMCAMPTSGPSSRTKRKSEGALGPSTSRRAARYTPGDAPFRRYARGSQQAQ